MYALTLAVLGVVWLVFWHRFRDPFHPCIYLLPQFAFFYGYMPMSLQDSDPARFAMMAGFDAVDRYQSIVALLILTLVAGVMATTAGMNRRSASWPHMELTEPDLARRIGTVAGAIGMAAWLYSLNNSGGLIEAYSVVKGGGEAESGYLRRLQFIGFVGAPLVFLSRTGKHMRPIDWALIMLCVGPTLLHGLLSARRGPTFLALTCILGGYVYFMRRRVSLPIVVVVGVGIGMLLLFLVENRDQIYIGSDFSNLEDPLAFNDRWTSNEYLIGLHAMRYADLNGYYWGTRELAWLIARFVPNALWPSIFADVTYFFDLDIDLAFMGGMNRLAIARVSPFMPTFGSAPGYVGDMWQEFGPAALLASFVIGAIFGGFWKAARTSLPARVTYILLVSLSVYLVAQGLDPWLYQGLLLGVPAFVAARYLRLREAGGQGAERADGPGQPTPGVSARNRPG